MPQYLEKLTKVGEFENGLKLYKAFGKYQPNLFFITDKDVDEVDFVKYYNREGKLPFSIDKGSSFVALFKGQFRISKKGNPVFDLTRSGDYLYVIKWGGAFSDDRGIVAELKEKIKKDAKYYRWARSNGGGFGYEFVVLPEDYKPTISEDDF